MMLFYLYKVRNETHLNYTFREQIGSKMIKKAKGIIMVLEWCSLLGRERK